MLLEFPLLCLAIIQISAHYETLDDDSSSTISGVLKSYQYLQIIIRVRQRVSSSETNVSPLMQSMIVETAVVFALENGQPLQLFTSYIGRSATFHVGRHVKNQISWFIFMTTESKVVATHVVTDIVMWTRATKGVQRPIPPKHFLNLIIVHTTADKFKMDFYIEAIFTPLYLMIFHVHSLKTTSMRLPEAFDVCYDRKTCRIIKVPAYFALAQAGIQRVVQHVNKIRKNFKGDRLFIELTEKFEYSWESWAQFFALPWRLRKQRQLRQALLGDLLQTFAAMHNFTFDTFQSMPTHKRTALQKRRGLIMMSSAILNSALFMTPVLSLSEFIYLSTLTSTDLVQPSAYELQSLAMPMGPTATCALVVAALCIGLILSAKAWNSDLLADVLLALASLVSRFRPKTMVE